jgi:YfiH family protein
MNDCLSFKIATGGLKYIDYSSFLKVPSGTIIRNNKPSFPESTGSIIDEFFLSAVDSRKTRVPVLVEPNQKHTSRVADVSEDLEQPADGVFTDYPGYVLIVKTADCFPVFFYDNAIAGLLHVGWRSALTGIIKNFFRRAQRFNIDKGKALIGPGIGHCCFEVAPEVALLFHKKYRRLTNSKYHLDLAGFIVDELTGFGIKYIKNCDACTACNEEYFYSYRREGTRVKQMISYLGTGGDR